MKLYDTTFFVNSDERIRVHIETNESQNYPISIRINGSTDSFSHPSVIFFLKSTKQLDDFLASVDEQRGKLAAKELKGTFDE